MIIEGLDIATSCGVAQVEKPGRLSAAAAYVSMPKAKTQRRRPANWLGN